MKLNDHSCGHMRPQILSEANKKHPSYAERKTKNVIVLTGTLTRLFYALLRCLILGSKKAMDTFSLFFSLYCSHETELTLLMLQSRLDEYIWIIKFHLFWFFTDFHTARSVFILFHSPPIEVMFRFMMALRREQ